MLKPLPPVYYDVPEDTKYKLADIKKYLGEDIAFLVDSVTKLSNLEYGQIRYREGLKMFSYG